ncbi:MAG: flavodoxin [bacterium]
MKKWMILLLSLMLVAGFVVFSSQSSKKSIQAAKNTSEASDFSAASHKQGKALVVYYSATGNTKEVADYIAEEAEADIFAVEATKPYSDADLDWTNDNSRVSYEHNNPDARVVELVRPAVSDWKSYDIVFVGYPVWWGIAAWPIDGFVKANDFTGKTVIPFCTSVSSGMGESGRLLAKLAGTGNWQEGKRFSSGTSEKNVKSWVRSLNL